ncbi:MAG: acetylglutamate kinase [Micavibrio sp.]|nr:acetylglutamate kinase [Micavibrio sp.]
MKKSNIPNFLIEAFYEGRFKDNIFIVKAGGKIIEDQKSLDNLLSNIRDLTLRGIKVLLVYGHGRAVDEKLKSSKIEVKKIKGRRVTDAATLAVIQEVVGGLLSMNVNSSMARNNLPGLCLGTVPADWMNVELRPKHPVDFGFVGDIKDVEAGTVLRLFKMTNFIACSCLGVTAEGQVCNINADTVATQFAVGLKAHKLVFLSDVDGVIVAGKVADVLTVKEIPGLIKKSIVKDGMQVKLESCTAALLSGVRRIHLINGLRKDALRKEIFESKGHGTMIIQDSERDVNAREIEVQQALERHSKRKKRAK